MFIDSGFSNFRLKYEIHGDGGGCGEQAGRRD